MTQVEPTAQRCRTMARVRSKNTTPELTVRRAMHAAGFRYRLHRKDLPGKPDLVFPRYRVAVFVHGCFWHWHRCGRTKMPVANAEYWRRKIDGNVRRDHTVVEALRAQGWVVHTIWECGLDVGTAELVAMLRNLGSCAPSVQAQDATQDVTT